MRRADLALIALCLLLAGALALELHLGLEEPEPALPRPGGEVPALPALAGGFAPPPPGAFDAVQSRPLFVPERRPAAAGVAAAPAMIQLRLVGIVTVAGRATAVLRGPDGRTHTLAEGQQGPGWTVLRVERDRVTVEDPAGRHELPLTARPRDPSIGAVPMGLPPNGLGAPPPGQPPNGVGEVRYR